MTITRHTGLDVLRACQNSPLALAQELDIDPAEAKRWAKIAEVYFGKTRFRAKQRRAVSLAGGVSISRLVMVERFARRIADAAQQWEFRLRLLQERGTFSAVKRLAGELIEDYAAPREPSRGVRVQQHSSRVWTLSIRDHSTRISTLLKTLESKASPYGERKQQLADAFWDTLASNNGLLTPTYRTVVAIGLPDVVRILRGHGDDVLLGCSDGTAMTGAQWLGSAQDQEVFAGLFHPVHGPVNLYSARFASFKQRVLAMAESLVCAWPGCKVPADRCEVHHLQAHAKGGHTTPANLTMTCRYHNGVAGTGESERGGLARRGGRVVHHWPGGRDSGLSNAGNPKRQSAPPVSHLGAMSLI